MLSSITRSLLSQQKRSYVLVYNRLQYNRLTDALTLMLACNEWFPGLPLAVTAPSHIFGKVQTDDLWRSTGICAAPSTLCCLYKV